MCAAWIGKSPSLVPTGPLAGLGGELAEEEEEPVVVVEVGVAVEGEGWVVDDCPCLDW